MPPFHSYIKEVRENRRFGFGSLYVNGLYHQQVGIAKQHNTNIALYKHIEGGRGPPKSNFVDAKGKMT